jgi:hypothetical protein
MCVICIRHFAISNFSRRTICSEACRGFPHALQGNSTDHFSVVGISVFETQPGRISTAELAILSEVRGFPHSLQKNSDQFECVGILNEVVSSFSQPL